jgi:hypothetical protein
VPPPYLVMAVPRTPAAPVTMATCGDSVSYICMYCTVLYAGTKVTTPPRSPTHHTHHLPPRHCPRLSGPACQGCSAAILVTTEERPSCVLCVSCVLCCCVFCDVGGEGGPSVGIIAIIIAEKKSSVSDFCLGHTSHASHPIPPTHTLYSHTQQQEEEEEEEQAAMRDGAR